MKRDKRFFLHGLPEPLASEIFPIPEQGAIVEYWWPGLQAWFPAIIIGMNKGLLYYKTKNGSVAGDLPTKGNFRLPAETYQHEMF